MFEKIYIDICGQWNETIRREKYIFGIIDHFSKYVCLRVNKRQDEEKIIQTIINNYICININNIVLTNHQSNN